MKRNVDVENMDTSKLSPESYERFNYVNKMNIMPQARAIIVNLIYLL